MVYLLFFVASVWGSVLTWRALKEDCGLLIASTGPLLGAASLVALSNAGTPPSYSLAGLSVATVVVALWPGRQRPVLPVLSKGQWCGLAVLSLLVTCYTLYHQVNVLDGDRWLHDAQIVAFHRGIYPPVNPLFPELAMNGHFGRDLLMATLHQDGADPALTTWWVTPWLQLASFLTLFSFVRVQTASTTKGFFTSCLVFFGMDCGFRVGLLDTFDGSNGLAWAQLVLLFYLMNKILLGARWPHWVVSGVVLGTYQLIYMTNFATLLLTGFVLFVCKGRSKTAWVGLLVTGFLAMGLAVTEGGAFTDMAQRGLKPELDTAVQNQGLRVSVQFPKEEIFKVATSTAGYYRTSVAYQTSLFKGLYQPPVGEGYVSIFNPNFMMVHWLPLYLAPFTLWFLRRSGLGLSFWIFGAISYLLPGLFYFGPIFEYEYYRFEFSAAFGFAGALGLTLGEFLDRKSPLSWEKEPRRLVFGPGTGSYLLAWLIAIASLAAGEKALNDAIIASQRADQPWFVKVAEWRVKEPTFGLTPDHLRAAAWMRERTRPGEQILTNFLNDRPDGMWPDVVTATLSGAFPAAHAFPTLQAGIPHGNPAFHPNSVYRSFWATGEWTYLEGLGVRFAVADVGRLPAQVVDRLRTVTHQEFGSIWVMEVPPMAVAGTGDSDPAQWSLVGPVERPEDQDLRLGVRYPIKVKLQNPGKPSRAVITLEGSDVAPLTEKVDMGSAEATWSLVTPLDEGSFEALVRDSEDKVQARFPLKIDFLERLSRLEPNLELPEFLEKSFYRLPVQWSLDSPLRTQGEIELSYRFKRPGAEYVWEVDLIPQEMSLELPEKNTTELQVLTPLEPGSYELEFWLYDRGSRRRVKIKKTFPVLVHPQAKKYS